MLDIALIRKDPEWVKQQMRNLVDEAAVARVDEIVRLDEVRRELIQQRRRRGRRHRIGRTPETSDSICRTAVTIVRDSRPVTHFTLNWRPGTLCFVRGSFYVRGQQPGPQLPEG